MPTLDWIAKEKVVNHHLEVPYRVLEPQYTYGEDNGNMIIHGDNLEALKSLLPEYEGKIKCIYIDPPYNTAKSTDKNKAWVYSDNVDDPRIKEWLGKVVGPENEDLSRHDKWLCMMYPRLRLLHRLLSEDGAIFISIDDNELIHLSCICNEIFGANNFIERITVIVKPEGRRYGYFAKTDQELLVYAKNKNYLELNEIEVEGKKYDYYDEKGGFTLKGLRNRNVRAFNSVNRPNLRYPFFVDISNSDNNGLSKVSTYPLQGYEEVWASTIDDLESVWRWGKEKSNRQIDDLCAYRGNDGIIRIFQKERKLTETAKSVWTDKQFHSIVGTREIKSIFNEFVFEFPKPISFIRQILSIGSNEDSIILDSFAGSGTTGQAVLDLNRSDGGNRKFILIEMGDYADTITAERIKRFINKPSEKKIKQENLFDVEITIDVLKRMPQALEDAKIARKEAIASGRYSTVNAPKVNNGHLVVVATIETDEQSTTEGFTFYELGEKILDVEHLNENVSLDKIRSYVYFTETKQPISDKADETYYLGTYLDTAYYFYYDNDTATTLNHDFLTTIKTKAKNYVIYADRCILSDEELEKYHITFKKIPRDITRL